MSLPKLTEEELLFLTKYEEMYGVGSITIGILKSVYESRKYRDISEEH